MELAFFSIVALVAIVSSILVITNRNPINSALSLVMTFFCLATLYVMLDAPFMAAVQVIVYAGAIMVLIVFVIMLLNIKVEAGRQVFHAVLAGSLVGIAVLVETIYFLKSSVLSGVRGDLSTSKVLAVGHTELIGRALFTDFLLPFEITSILLLVAIIGSVILAKKKL